VTRSSPPRSVGCSASLHCVSSKVDRELAEIEARKAAAEPQAKPRKQGAVKRFFKDVVVRRHSTKR
jgi:hypothetical protein